MANPPAATPEPDDMTQPRLTMRADEVWFDRFVLKQIIGQGGMGVVWSAWDQRLKESVALKFLPEQLRWDAAALAALRQETQSARRLSHPNIVRVHDLHESEDGVALVMALIEGETLTSWRMKHPGGVVDPEEIIPWLPGLCSALDYAHQEVGMVHHDIKPANLLLTYEGLIQVTDFGIASTVTDTMARISSMPSGGTLTYMSPQQLWDEPAGAADDIYALGATLYELLCGQPPFVRGDISRQIETRPPRSPSSLRQQMDPRRDALPEQWENLILACLAKQSEKRPHSAGEVLARLTTSTASHQSQPLSRRPWRFALMGVAAIAAVSLSASLLHNQFRPPHDAQPAMADPKHTVAAPAPRNVFGSMGMGMLAHYPFDRSTLDYCSGGYDGTGQNISYTPDRFGTPESALRIESISRLHMSLGRAPHGEQNDALTISSWIRLVSSEGNIFRLKSAVDVAHGMSLIWQTSRLMLVINYLDTSQNIQLPTPALDDLNQWHHVMAVFAGPQVKLYLDGALAIATTLPEAHMKPDAGLHLQIGKQAPAGIPQMDFELDDLRIWRRPLSEESARSLTLEDHQPVQRIVYSEAPEWPWESNQSYITTAASYNFENNWLDAVQSEFGDEAKVADWDEVKLAAGPWPSLWAEIHSMKGGSHLLRSGQPYFGKRRAYQMERYYGSIPHGYLAHAYMGSRELVLGSWRSTMPLLARVPNFHEFRQTSWEPGPENNSSAISIQPNGSWQYKSNTIHADGTGATKRIWMIHLESSIVSERGYHLSLSSGATASLLKIAEGAWEMVYRSNPDANHLKKSIMMNSKPKLWVVVQSPDHVYQTLVEKDGRQTVYAELIAADSITQSTSDFNWTLQPTTSLSSKNDTSSVKSVTKIQYITQL